jgi:hypothetical protein
MDSDPLTKGNANGDGRDLATGRFAKGWRGGPGNPFAGEVGKRRAQFFASLRDDDVSLALETIRTVMLKGKDGERLAAAKEMLDRVLGKGTETIILEKLAELERELGLKVES